jgi:hypothetical protein
LTSDRRKLTNKCSRGTGRKQRGVLEKHEHTKEQGEKNEIGSEQGTNEDRSKEDEKDKKKLRPKNGKNVTKSRHRRLYLNVQSRRLAA